MNRTLAPALWLGLLAFGCAPTDRDARTGTTADVPALQEEAPPAPVESPPLPASCSSHEAVDESLAEQGKRFLFSGGAGGTLLPRVLFQNLWVVWTSTKPSDVPAAIRQRYGFVKSPLPGSDLPAGFTVSGSNVLIDCLVCHAGEVAGQTVVGAPGNQVDLELFIGDLKRLANTLGQTPPETPNLRTGARGVSDIVGMTMQLALREKPTNQFINQEIGFQDPPAWWTYADKTRMYTDGSSPQAAHRVLMATQMAFGTSIEKLEALEPEYVGLREFLKTIQAPAWPFEPPPAESVARGQKLFRQKCTSCHRDDRCDRTESVVVPQSTVGTDSERALKYGDNEVALLNNSWFGEGQPHAATLGYLAPSLRGVWASAPYFHNASVPTLEGVLNSSKRPAVFRLRGTRAEDYDSAAVGLRYDTVTPGSTPLPREERARVYDTRTLGLGNRGHLFGDSLSEAERADVIHFLKTL